MYCYDMDEVPEEYSWMEFRRQGILRKRMNFNKERKEDGWRKSRRHMKVDENFINWKRDKH